MGFECLRVKGDERKSIPRDPRVFKISNPFMIVKNMDAPVKTEVDSHFTFGPSRAKR